MWIKGIMVLIVVVFEGRDDVVNVLLFNGVKLNFMDDNGNIVFFVFVFVWVYVFCEIYKKIFNIIFKNYKNF